MLERGVAAAEHPRRWLVPELLASDVHALTVKQCEDQEPRLGGYESHNPVLVVARNRRASQLATELGVDGLTETVLLRETESYVPFAVDPIVQAVQTARVVAVVGGPGTGKATLAAALRRPPDDDVPLGVVDAIAFIGTGTVPELARTIRGQLDRLPYFPDATRRYQKANAFRWKPRRLAAADHWTTDPLSAPRTATR